MVTDGDGVDKTKQKNSGETEVDCSESPPPSQAQTSAA